MGYAIVKIANLVNILDLAMLKIIVSELVVLAQLCAQIALLVNIVLEVHLIALRVQLVNITILRWLQLVFYAVLAIMLTQLHRLPAKLLLLDITLSVKAPNFKLNV